MGPVPAVHLTARDQLTVVLTLKDRVPFTLRWMHYMDDARCPFPIVIADGGTDGAAAERLRRPEHYPHLRFEYLRYPVDRDYAAYCRKLADAVERVPTPYVLLADNDDFFLLEPVGSFLELLDTQPEVVSCGGQAVHLQLLSTDGHRAATPVAAAYSAVVDTRDKSITDPRPVERMCEFMTTTSRGLWSSWYHVHRTTALQAALRMVRAHTFSDPLTFEIHVHLTLLATGQYRQLAVPFWVRQRGTSQLSADLDAVGTLFERFTRNNSLEDLRRSVSSSSLSSEDRQRVDHAISEWWAGQAPRHQTVLDRVGRRFTRWLARAARPAASVRAPVRLPTLEKYILDRP
ncbi:MAG TPA: TIGR00180 family glycosyltransferase [Vicinamibacterales bacterium]|nr:TIGR00180 family glycosyltransferase [Vicinamibacterales bacterium]